MRGPRQPQAQPPGRAFDGGEIDHVRTRDVTGRDLEGIADRRPEASMAAIERIEELYLKNDMLLTE